MKNWRADAAVIGGGAAGMLASALAAERGIRTVVFEPNPYTGKKLGITGKGRCNVTNEASAREVMEQIPTNGRFLFSALHRFGPADVMEMFESLGVPLKTERGGRVFPASDKAEDIVAALRRRMRRAGVELIHERVTEILTENGAVKGVRTEAGAYPCRAAVLCTGGISYPGTGSTGDGYKLASACGHTVVQPRGSLVPLEAAGTLCGLLQGLALKNIRITVFENEKPIFTDFGELLFTHFGLSGPVVLSASAHMRRYDSCRYRAEIDLKPALDPETLDRRVLSDLDKYKNSDFCNGLGDLLPRKMIPQIPELCGIDPRKKCHSVTREERGALVRLLKAFPVEITGPRPAAEAIITSGGVSVREVDPGTMQSRLTRGLFFAGEILDVDAYTGGFNLQIAWSTAYAAAMGLETDGA